MARLLLVCLGGALGSGARYLASAWMLRAFGPDLPRGTLLVNVSGSFLLAGIMTASLQSEAFPPDLRLFLAAGVMGGFTTYSSFNYETLALLEQGRLAAAAGYLLATVLGCLAAAMAATLLVRWLAG